MGEPRRNAIKLKISMADFTTILPYNRTTKATDLETTAAFDVHKRCEQLAGQSRNQQNAWKPVA